MGYDETGALSGAGSDSAALSGPSQADSAAPTQANAASAPTPSPATSPAAAAVTQPAPGLWRRVLTGALVGLAQGGIPGALVGGIESTDKGQFQHMQQNRDLAMQRKQLANQETQSNIRVKDAQAGSYAAEELIRSQQYAQMPEEARMKREEHEMKRLQFDQAMGFPVIAAMDNTDEGANRAAEDLTKNNGGIPASIVRHVGDQKFVVDYSGNPSGQLKVANEFREATGQDPIPDMPTFMRMYPRPQDRTAAAKQGDDFFRGAHADSIGKAQDNLNSIDHQIEVYKRNKGANADPKILEKMNDLKNLYQTDVKSFQDESDRKARVAADLAKTREKGKIEAQSDNYNQAVRSDAFGWTPPAGIQLTNKELNSARAKFANGALKDADNIDKAYEMFQGAYNNRNNATTGASSMLALSQHLGTTFGSIKGSRITKDQIQDHMHARSVSDDMVVMFNKLLNGDRLSEGQWNEFHTLISHARQLTWENTVNQAHASGVPVFKEDLPESLRSRINNGQ